MMKKIVFILLSLMTVLTLVIPVSAFEPVTGNLTEEFVLEMSEAAPALDGVVGEGEYTLISSYDTDNEDWFVVDYNCVRQYVADGLPTYTIDVYGSWDDKGVYVAVVTDCNDHKVNRDPVWNGCGVMIGFVAEAPDGGKYDSYSGYSAMDDVLKEIAFNYTADGSMNLNNTTNDAVHGKNVNTVYKNENGCDVYEMFFTWDFIGCEPAVDKAIGLGLMVSKNSLDAADGIDWVCFQTDVVNAKLPQTYTKLVLKDDVKSEAGEGDDTSESSSEPETTPAPESSSEEETTTVPETTTEEETTTVPESSPEAETTTEPDSSVADSTLPANTSDSVSEKNDDNKGGLPVGAIIAIVAAVAVVVAVVLIIKKKK